MTAVLLGVAAVVAVAAAVRSTWSPCGLSMLSTITPFTERARGHRFAVTASWFVVGALVGGATLGLGAALVAALVAATGLAIRVAVSIGIAAALIAAAVDSGVLGMRPPFFRRQVNDDWLGQYRPWVYGAGFGWQIGAGLATYIMTSGVILAVLLGALSGSVGAAFAIGVGFGLVRGLAVWVGVGATDPAALRRLHQRFDELEAPVRNVVTAVECLAAVVLAAAVSPVAAVVALVLVLGGLALGLPRSRRLSQAAATADR